NQPITFIIDKKGEIDFLSRLRLCTTLKFSVDDTATNPTYLPGLPIFMIRKIELYNANNLVISYDSHEIYQEIYMHTDQNYWDFTAKHYGLGDATSRTVEDGQTITFYLNFEDIWSMFQKPFPIYKLHPNYPLEFRIYFNDQYFTSDASKITYTFEKCYM